MSSQKQQSHIPYYFRSQLRPVRRPVFISQLGSGHETPHRNQQNLEIASHDLPLARLRELSEDLEITNILGRMVTFDVLTLTWVEWQRPVRHFLNGSTRPVAASGLESFEDLVRPLCPHAANGFRLGCEMHVHRKTDHGKVTWVFQASHDECEFMVNIPDIPRSFDYILRDLDIRPRNRNRRNRSRASTSSSPSLRIQRHGRLNVARPIPSTPSSTSASSSSGPRLSSSSPATPSSSSSVALMEDNDRSRTYDKVLGHVERMENLLNITCKSRSHEAADRDLPPTCLMSYHPAFDPVPFTHLQFYDSMIGRAVREWNSPAGVSTEVWFYILASNVLCYGCQKMYSIDGLEAHAPNGICGSDADHRIPFHISSLPFTPRHLIGTTSNPPAALLEFHPMSKPPASFDVFLHSMVGRAYLEWNSDVGVTVEAWKVLSTAEVVCGGCNKVRSLDGDCAHRDDAGRPLCNSTVQAKSPIIDISDDEDENLPTIDKGKRRAYENF